MECLSCCRPCSEILATPMDVFKLNWKSDEHSVPVDPDRIRSRAKERPCAAGIQPTNISDKQSMVARFVRLQERPRIQPSSRGAGGSVGRRRRMTCPESDHTCDDDDAKSLNRQRCRIKTERQDMVWKPKRCQATYRHQREKTIKALFTR